MKRLQKEREVDESNRDDVEDKIEQSRTELMNELASQSMKLDRVFSLLADSGALAGDSAQQRSTLLASALLSDKSSGQKDAEATYHQLIAKMPRAKEALDKLVAELLKIGSVSVLMARIDRDQSGVIEPKELRRMFSLWKVDLSDDDFTNLVKVVDRDGNGKVSIRELQGIL